MVTTRLLPDCRVTGEFETGDHVAVFGEVVEGRLLREGEPSTHVRKSGLPVRVAIATGAGDTDLMSDAILLKPDAFFTKPIDATELVSWLASNRAGQHS